MTGIIDNEEPHEHPLEKVFNIEPGSSFVPALPQLDDATERAKEIFDPTSGEFVQRSSVPVAAELDREERIEDLQIDTQLDTIHTSAMIAFEKSQRLVDEVDPKFAARNAEVAAQYLNIALNAVNSRVDAKFKRQKIRLAKEESPAPSTVNNNVIFADRNDLLRQLFGAKNQVIEKDVKEE